jgi:hypothetical protein
VSCAAPFRFTPTIQIIKVLARRQHEFWRWDIEEVNDDVSMLLRCY